MANKGPGESGASGAPQYPKARGVMGWLRGVAAGILGAGAVAGVSLPVEARADEYSDCVSEAKAATRLNEADRKEQLKICEALKVGATPAAGAEGAGEGTPDPAEEAKGIDGYIGDHPVSIKPQSYESKQMLPESIGAQIIYYDKVKDGINIFLKNSDIVEPINPAGSQGVPLF